MMPSSSHATVQNRVWLQVNFYAQGPRSHTWRCVEFDSSTATGFSTWLWQRSLHHLDLLTRCAKVISPTYSTARRTGATKDPCHLLSHMIQIRGLQLSQQSSKSGGRSRLMLDTCSNSRRRY